MLDVPRVRELLRKAKRNQSWLAIETGYSRTFVSYLIRGLRHASWEAVQEIARALGVAPKRLIASSENTKKKAAA